MVTTHVVVSTSCEGCVLNPLNNQINIAPNEGWWFTYKAASSKQSHSTKQASNTEL